MAPGLNRLTTAAAALALASSLAAPSAHAAAAPAIAPDAPPTAIELAACLDAPDLSACLIGILPRLSRDAAAQVGLWTGRVADRRLPRDADPSCRACGRWCCPPAAPTPTRPSPMSTACRPARA